MCNKEIVICAAIWVQDGKKRPHQPINIPSGTVFCGLRHCSIISQFAAYGIAHKNRSVQGFLTSKKRLWGKKVSDLSHSSFIDKLMYVASKYGVTIHKIDKWYPSSKTCECGCINKGLSLRDRTWVCPACGAINDRDVLAARNILRKGISGLESKSNSNDSNIGVSCACIQESHSL